MASILRHGPAGWVIDRKLTMSAVGTSPEAPSSPMIKRCDPSEAAGEPRGWRARDHNNRDGAVGRHSAWPIRDHGENLLAAGQFRGGEQLIDGQGVSLFRAYSGSSCRPERCPTAAFNRFHLESRHSAFGHFPPPGCFAPILAVPVA
jgi:hypothetical protein